MTDNNNFTKCYWLKLFNLLCLILRMDTEETLKAILYCFLYIEYIYRISYIESYEIIE